MRNTNCPLCSFHVFKLCKIVDELTAHGLKILVFYESQRSMFEKSKFFQENVFQHKQFSVISDPERKVYGQYQVEISPQKATLQALQAAGRIADVQEAAKLGISGNGQEAGTHPDAIPADFLIGEDLNILHAHYGNDAGDNISLDMVRGFAKSGKVSA
ncbi:MAG: redoxin domain-containing protein [Bacteroidia bacterium]|nr:redoxin domain-containing protein [Bacteroidia bacterium]